MIRLRVKEVAEQKQISMGKLSRTADVAYNTIKAIYRDPYKEVTTTTLNKIAAALGVPVCALIEEVPEKMTATATARNVTATIAIAQAAYAIATATANGTQGNAVRIADEDGSSDARQQPFLLLEEGTPSASRVKTGGSY